MKKILLWDLGSKRNEFNEPIGIEILLSHLSQEIEGITIDCRWGYETDFFEALSVEDYRVVGISLKLGMLKCFSDIYLQLNNLKNPPLIIVGDTIPTFAYEELLDRFPNIVCVRGEGETAIKEIVRRTIKDCKFDRSKLIGIPNTIIKFNDKNYEGKREVEDLKLYIPPKRIFLDQTILKNGIVRIEGSRGCPWGRCDFCCIDEKYGSYVWRPVPVDIIIEELRYLSAKGVKSPYFTDEDFFGEDYARSFEIARRIIYEKSLGRIDRRMNFFISARAIDIARKGAEPLLDLWKEAGLREVFVGIESGSKEQLNRYNKIATADINFTAIKILKTKKFDLDIGFILFDPCMTLDELEENVDYLDSLEISSSDSRSIKDLRVQPLTEYANRMLASTDVDLFLDVDDLRYDVKYYDIRVYNVLCMFKVYENHHSEIVYEVQSMSRGEMESEEQRRYYKDILGDLRKLDFEGLKIMIRHVRDNGSALSIDGKIIKKLEAKRIILSDFSANKISGYRNDNSCLCA